MYSNILHWLNRYKNCCVYLVNTINLKLHKTSCSISLQVLTSVWITLLDRPGNDIIVTFLNSWCLRMTWCNQLVFESCYGLNTFLLESLEASIESLLQVVQTQHSHTILQWLLVLPDKTGIQLEKERNSKNILKYELRNKPSRMQISHKILHLTGD